MTEGLHLITQPLDLSNLPLATQFVPWLGADKCPEFLIEVIKVSEERYNEYQLWPGVKNTLAPDQEAEGVLDCNLLIFGQ
jgi:hypothetical protein